MTLALAPDTRLPRAKRLFSQARVSRRRRDVSLQSLGARGRKPDAFAALVGRYLAASRARMHLSATSAGI